MRQGICADLMGDIDQVLDDDGNYHDEIALTFTHTLPSTGRRLGAARLDAEGTGAWVVGAATLLHVEVERREGHGQGEQHHGRRADRRDRYP